MDFNQLMAKMRELDTPQTTEGCGDAMPSAPMTPPMPQAPMPPEKPDTPPPSMSVNLNAQGMDNIESMMKLFQKVNPDMMPSTPAPMPSLTTPPGIISVQPSQGPDDMPKGLPDLSDEPQVRSPGDDRGLPPDHDKDHDIVKTLDRDGDGDHDMDDHELEKNKREEAYANEPDEMEHELDSIIRTGDDLHKQKGTYPKVAGGDNPMQNVSESDQEARDYMRDMKTRIQNGEVNPDEVESEFFNTMAFYGMDDDRIMSTWDRITGQGQSQLRRNPSDNVQDDLKDLIKLTRDADSDDMGDDDIDQFRSQAKSGRLNVDRTEFESVKKDLRSQIREELQQKLSELKSK